MTYRLLLAVAILVTSNWAFGQCQFANNEISNPFQPGCGDRMLTYTESTVGPNLIPLGYPPPLPVSSLTAIDGFRTYDSLNALHQDLALLNPDVRVEQIGATLSGRPIWAYVLGDTDALTTDGQAEAAVMMIGGIHAREWQTPEALSAILEYLAASANDGAIGSYLRDNLNVVLVPVLNIDGFMQAQAHHDRVSADPAQPREGRMRRRNLRNPNNGMAIDDTIDTVADNFWGVDLNRNSPQGWGRNNGSSASVTSLVYRGPTATSEPEIVALQAGADLGPRNRLRLFIDVHSFSQVYLSPSTGNPRRDNYTAVLAGVMRAVHSFKYGFVADPADGGIGVTVDWFAYTFDIPSWTLEIEPLSGAQQYGGTASHGHSGFILPDAEVARVRDEMVEANLIGFYRQAGPPYVQTVRIADANTGELRYSASWQNGAVRTLNVAENLALQPGASYRLYLGFSKPMRFQSVAGGPANYPGQQTGPIPGDIELQIPSQDAVNDIVVDLSTIEWHDQPDGASNGYQQYLYDAASVDFSIPAGAPITGSEPVVLSLLFRDMSDFLTDSDPATVTDWVNGGWAGFEDVSGASTDVGGYDCNFRPFIALDATAAAPAGNAVCRAATAVPPPPPVPPPPTRRNGGGGGALWLTGLLLLMLRRRPGNKSGE